MSVETAPFSEKSIALETLQRMPDSVTLEDICDELAILASIRRGEADGTAGRVVSHAEVKRKSAGWASSYLP